MTALPCLSEGFTNSPGTAPHRILSQGAGLLAPSAPCPVPAVGVGSRDVPGEEVPAFTVHMETPADAAAREALLDRAMGAGRRRKSSEKLRRGRLPAQGLAFVARDGAGAVIGTVRLWNVSAGEGGTRALLLGPLAVDPSVKSAGIGSALMRQAIAEARRRGHAAILLVGDAPYYGRFGFTAEKTGALAMPGPYERERFLALELKDGALEGAHGVLRAAGQRLRQDNARRAA